MSNLPDNMDWAAFDARFGRGDDAPGYELSDEARIIGALDGLMHALTGDADALDGVLDQAARDCVTGDDDDGAVLQQVRADLDYRAHPHAALSLLTTMLARKTGRAAQLAAHLATARFIAGLFQRVPA